MMGVPYVGCGVLASAACMDKHYTKVLLAAAGIPVAPGITLDARSFDKASEFKTDADAIMAQVSEAGLQYPLFVKPSRAGSSFGVTKVEHEGDAAELAAAVYEASRHDWRILVEQGIDAREIECAVLCPKAGEAPQASWPGEIVLDKRAEGDDQFYDFDSKYMDAAASHVEVPANLPEETLNLVRETAKKAFVAVDGAGLSRVDTFVTKDGKEIAKLHPEKRNYYSSRSMPMTEAAIKHSIDGDIYVSLGEPVGDGAWIVRAYRKPFVTWIWWGTILMSLGGFIAILDRRYRTSRKKNNRATQGATVGA